MSKIAHQQRGFTLIELMIIVAILGVVASIALVSYRQYVQTAEEAIVATHYEQAIDAVRGHMVKRRAQTGIGTSGVEPPDAAAWVLLVDPDGTFAPDGGPAYAPGTGDPVTGTVGLEMTGSWAARDVAITLHRPSYNALPAESVAIPQ